MDSSSLLMGSKVDGCWWLSGNFHCLNLVTELNVYLLPDMLDFAMKAPGTVDLRMEYYQIPVLSADIP
jgi:hypothetical protein